MNQNLLIVDDEAEILSWLAELFKYEFTLEAGNVGRHEYTAGGHNDSGVRKTVNEYTEERDRELGVYTANSAMEAVRLLAKIRFDVVLTDIRMPGMDGITLFRHIKENWPRCKTVFLTGYRNFEDVYQIINQGDVKYILKSEDDAVIMDAVRDFLLMSRQELEREMQQKEQERWMKEAKYWLKQDFMNQLCAGSLPDNPNERMQSLGIPLDAGKEVLPFFLRIEKDWKEQEKEPLFQEEALIAILQENVPLKLKFYVHILGGSQELLLVQPIEETADWQMVAVISQGAVEYAQERFRNLYNATVSAVAASEPVLFADIAVCLRRMKQYMFGYMGGAREAILRLDAVAPESEERACQDYFTWMVSLRNLLETRKQQDYFALLRKCLREMAGKSSSHDTIALEIYYSISVLLLQFINTNHLNEQMAFRLGIYKLTRVEEHESWAQAAEYLTEVSEAIFSLLETNENNLANHALGRVVDYIEKHLDEELSLTMLADVGGFNASYLSRLFRQMQNETISDFILHKRIELARDMLANSNEKIQKIAARTGYLSPHSFTRAFRNEVGISPTEYREMKMGERSGFGQPM